MRFDHFEGFVHEAGGINGDLLPHFPRRMPQRLVHRSTRYALRVPGAERSAGRGENEPGQLAGTPPGDALQDRKSTRLNSSHLGISYAVFCLKKKSITQ